MRVNATYMRWDHHAQPSGYPRVFDALGERVALRWLAPARLPRAVSRRWAPRARAPMYRAESLGYEIAVARRLLRPGGGICHFLYGEWMLEYLPRLAPERLRLGGPVVATFHLAPRRLKRWGPGEQAMRSLDAVVALNPLQADYLGTIVGSERVFVAHHGVNTAFFAPDPGVEYDKHLFLCVGHTSRDFDVLSEVARRVGSREPRARFEVVAPLHKHPRLAQRLVDQQRAGRVTVRHGLSDAQLRRAYQSAAALFLPLRDATANNALMESLACGTPIVTTDVGGVRYYTGGDAACLRARDDLDGMGDDLLEISADRDRRSAMSAHCRRRALELDFQRAADSLMAVYRQLGGL